MSQQDLVKKVQALQKFAQELKIADKVLILEDNPDRIRTGVYQHYKGNNYLVVGESLHTETKEVLVNYFAISKTGNVDTLLSYSRPKEVFLDKVIIEDSEVNRFTYQDRSYEDFRQV